MLRGVFASYVAMASRDVTTSDLATYYCWPVTAAVAESPSSSMDYSGVIATDAPCLD